MRDELRTLRQSGMPLTDSRDAVQGDTLLARHCKQEMANLTRWVKQIDAVQFSAAIAALAQARSVMLLGLRNSYPVAMHLRQQRCRCGAGAAGAAAGANAGGRSGGLTPQDMAVVVAFRRRPRQIRRCWRCCKAAGCRRCADLRTAGAGVVPTGQLALDRAARQRVGVRQLCRRHEPGQPAQQCVAAERLAQAAAYSSRRRTVPGAGRTGSCVKRGRSFPLPAPSAV